MNTKKTLIGPPKIKHVRVNWMCGWGNSPQWEVEFDRSFEYKEFRYKEAGGVVLGFYGDAADFKTARGDGHGYGGATFEFTMLDGSIKKVHGPWSSSSSHVNKFFGVADHVTECTDVTDDRRTSCAVRVRELERWLRAHSYYGLGLVRVMPYGDGSVTYEPTWMGRRKNGELGRVAKVMFDPTDPDDRAANVSPDMSFRRG